MLRPVSRVESVLLKAESVHAIVNAFCRSNNFEACLAAVLRIVSKSAVMSAALGSSSLFVTEVVRRLAYPKAIVRKSLLNVAKCLYKHHRDRMRLAVHFNLFTVVKQLSLAKGMNQVLVLTLAQDLLRSFRNDLGIGDAA